MRLLCLVGPHLASVLRSTRVLLDRAHHDQLSNSINLAGSLQLTKFLLAHQAWLPAERIVAVYVDRWTRLIGVKTLAEGNVAGTAFEPAAVIRLGVECGAAGVILVHNHLSGNAHPSDSDKRLTASFARLAQDLGMPLLQHVIVARGAVEFLDWPYR